MQVKSISIQSSVNFQPRKNNRKNCNGIIQSKSICNSSMVNDKFTSNISFSGSASKEVLELYKKANTIAKSDWREAITPLYEGVSRRVDEFEDANCISLDDSMAQRILSSSFLEFLNLGDEKIVETVPFREASMPLLEFAQRGYEAKGMHSLRGQTLLERSLCRILINPTKPITNVALKQSIQDFNEGNALLKTYGYMSGHKSAIFSPEYQKMVEHDPESTKELSNVYKQIIGEKDLEKAEKQGAVVGIAAGKILQFLSNFL